MNADELKTLQTKIDEQSVEAKYQALRIVIAITKAEAIRPFELERLREANRTLEIISNNDRTEADVYLANIGPIEP